MQRHAVAEARTTARAHALWYIAPRTVRIDAEALAEPADGEILVRAHYSAVSRGTERLVYAGLTHPAHRDAMRSPMQMGTFPFPVKYGYCSVGRVEAGPSALVGRDVFALHPHQDRFLMRAEDAVLLPEGLPARRATLAANMETALNALWDSGAGAGDRIVIVGAGVVGLLITYLAARLPGAEVTAIDPNRARAPLVAAFGARYASRPVSSGDADVVFHTSATAEGLAGALSCCAAEATLTEVSWFGDKPVEVPLGGIFHSRRVRLISSQVGEVPAQRRPRWSCQRRLRKALDLLGDHGLDALITDEVPFNCLPQRMADILEGGRGHLATVVVYG